MSQVKLRLPGFSHSESGLPFSEKAAPDAGETRQIELRILQDGKVYRSKAEQQRLNALGQWHHRRMRRRHRFGC